MNKNIWYSYDKVLSYNAMLNFIIGERGVGKSYGIKKIVIKIKTGSSQGFTHMGGAFFCARHIQKSTFQISKPVCFYPSGFGGKI